MPKIRGGRRVERRDFVVSVVETGRWATEVGEGAIVLEGLYFRVVGFLRGPAVVLRA